MLCSSRCIPTKRYFQLADLNDGKKFSNNANKFRSAFAKGKQGKGQGKDRGTVPYRKWRDEKGKRGNRNHQGNRSNDQGQTYTQIPIKPKEKGMAKDSKGKAKEKASHDTAIGRKTPTKGIIKTMRKSQ